VSCSNCGTDLTLIRRLQELPARWYNEALRQLHRGDVGEAITRLHSALALGEETPRVRRLLGKALWNAGRPTEAVEQWRMAPGDPEAQRLLGMAPAASTSVRKNRAVSTLLLVAALSFAAGAAAVTLLQSSPRSPAADAVQPILSAQHGAVEPVTRHKSRISMLARRLAGHRGLAVTREGDRLTIGFPAGLFDAGAETPTSDGRTTLIEIARDLAESGALHVFVEGVAGSEAVLDDWPDNVLRASDRARIAIDLMRREAGGEVVWIPRSAVGSIVPRPPGDDGVDLTESRSVVLRVEEP